MSWKVKWIFKSKLGQYSQACHYTYNKVQIRQHGSITPYVPAPGVPPHPPDFTPSLFHSHQAFAPADSPPQPGLLSLQIFLCLAPTHHSHLSSNVTSSGKPSLTTSQHCHTYTPSCFLTLVYILQDLCCYPKLSCLYIYLDTWLLFFLLWQIKPGPPLSCSASHPKCLELCLTQSRCSISMCWKNAWDEMKYTESLT